MQGFGHCSRGQSIRAGETRLISGALIFYNQLVQNGYFVQPESVNHIYAYYKSPCLYPFLLPSVSHSASLWASLSGASIKTSLNDWLPTRVALIIQSELPSAERQQLQKMVLHHILIDSSKAVNMSLPNAAKAA